MALEQSLLSVLLIEDNPGDARLVEHHLQAAVTDQYVDEVTLEHCETLEAGVEAATASVFDIVLLDLGLPKSTGLDTIDRIVTADIGIPIIVLTGLSDRDTAVEAISRGAQDYLPKDNLDGEQLIRSLRYAIERYEQARRLRRQTEQMAFFNQILRHDMLNGMNVIRARGEMLEASLDGEQQAFAQTVVEWSDDIIELTEKIRGILDTLTGEEEPTLRRVELAPMVHSAADRAETMGAHVTVDVPDSLAVRADDLLADVLGNITTNAVEHVGEDVTISITAEKIGNRVRMVVADDGPGIPEAEAETVFARGEKGSQSSGSGFGLYFVASMVDAYNGSVAVESADLGGAAFVVELPGAREFDD